jgi:hypothetical protein
MLFLAGLHAVFFEATKQVDSSGQRFEPSWLSIESTKLHRFRLSRALRAIIPTVLSRLRRSSLQARTVRAVMARLRRLALWSRMLRAVIARQRANALPSRTLCNLTCKVPLRMMFLVRRASLRNIILRWRPMRSKRGTLPTELARLWADALRAAGLSVLPTSLCIGLRFCRTAGRFLRVPTLIHWRIGRWFAAWLASIPAERQRFAAALQQGWHFTATGFGR